MPATSIDYESYIPQGSTIIGKTIKEVETEFKIKMDHFHFSIVEPCSRVSPAPDTILKAGMTIKIRDADREELAKFCKHFDLP